MKTARLIHVVAVLFALACRVCAQSGSNEPIQRLGLDISGIEKAKPASTIATTAKVAKPEKRPTGPVEITAHEATYDNRTNVGIFSSEVVVRHPEFGLNSDRLTVTIKASFLKGADQPEAKPNAPAENPKTPAEPGGGNLEKAVAEGHVIITQDKPDGNGNMQRYTGRGSRAVYDSKAGTLILYGWPQISQSIAGNLSKQIISREESCVITLYRSGKIDVKGYHTSTLQDTADLNQNPR